MGPLVSVIMPVYNGEKWLNESVASLISQTYTNWELLVTNDGSTDDSERILRSFQDDRIKIFVQQNKGVGAARNKSLSMMQGKYFTFLDADDQLSLDSLAIRVNFMEENPTTDIVSGKVEFFDDNGIQKTWKPAFKGDPFRKFIRIEEKVFCNPALFIRKKPNVTYQFKEGMTHVEDLLFFSSITAQQPHQYDFIDEVVYRYRVAHQSAMNNIKGLEQGYWIFYDSIKKFINVHPADLRHTKWKIMRIMFLSYLSAGNYRDAAGMFLKIFK